MTETSSVDAEEVAKFARLAGEWWDPTGQFAPLHRFNPVRLSFVRTFAARHFGSDPHSLQPFEGLTLLDIGCGGGLLAEPMARLGFSVMGADASDRNIAIAAAHAAQGGLSIAYRTTTAETLAEEGFAFDVVLNMEVVEHVADLGSYLSACGRLVRPGGLMFVATINKTIKSLAMAKFGAEYILGWLPRGTHDWRRFVKPAELAKSLSAHELPIVERSGVVMNPLTRRWSIGRDDSVTYLQFHRKA